MAKTKIVLRVSVTGSVELNSLPPPSHFTLLSSPSPSHAALNGLLQLPIG